MNVIPVLMNLEYLLHASVMMVFTSLCQENLTVLHVLINVPLVKPIITPVLLVLITIDQVFLVTVIMAIMIVAFLVVENVIVNVVNVKLIPILVLNVLILIEYWLIINVNVNRAIMIME